MRRDFLRALMVALPAMLVLAWVMVTDESRVSPAIPAAIEDYLAVRSEGGAIAGASQVKMLTVKARRPWLFTPLMSQGAYDSKALASAQNHTVPPRGQAGSTLFDADYGYIEPDAFTRAAAMSDLPYPPRALWCVWVDSSSTEVFLVADHYELYDVDRVVHVPLEGARLAELLDTIGCIQP